MMMVMVKMNVRVCAGVSAALQIQCYQCEDVRQDDCSSPEFVVNCTVNVQDMCQKEVLVMEDGKDAASLPVLPVAMVER